MTPGVSGSTVTRPIAELQVEAVHPLDEQTLNGVRIAIQLLAEACEPS